MTKSANAPLMSDAQFTLMSKAYDSRPPVIQQLQRQLANSIVLYLNFKLCGWKAEQYGSFTLQAEFSRLAGNMKSVYDGLDERIQLIAEDSDVALESLVEDATVRQVSRETAFESMLAVANANAMLVVRETRQAVAELSRDDHDDPASAELLSAVLKVYEAQAWYLRELIAPETDCPLVSN